MRDLCCICLFLFVHLLFVGACVAGVAGATAAGARQPGGRDHQRALLVHVDDGHRLLRGRLTALELKGIQHSTFKMQEV